MNSRTHQRTLSATEEPLLFRLIDETSRSISQIDFSRLNTLCHNNRSLRSLEKYLTQLLVQFDQLKGALPAFTRLSLRANLTALRKHCVQRNVSAEVLRLIQQLADHAHKLPESRTSMDDSR